MTSKSVLRLHTIANKNFNNIILHFLLHLDQHNTSKEKDRQKTNPNKKQFSEVHVLSLRIRPHYNDIENPISFASHHLHDLSVFTYFPFIIFSSSIFPSTHFFCDRLLQK